MHVLMSNLYGEHQLSTNVQGILFVVKAFNMCFGLCHLMKLLICDLPIRNGQS